MSVSTFGYLERAYLVDDYMTSGGLYSVNTQTTRQLYSSNVIHAQFSRRVEKTRAVRSQFDRRIAGIQRRINIQWLRYIRKVKPTRVQFDRRVYTARKFGLQYTRKIGTSSRSNIQAFRKIYRTTGTHLQVARMIQTSKKIRVQTLRQIIGSLKSGAQVLRIVRTTSRVKTQVDRRIETKRAIRIQMTRQIGSKQRANIQALRKIYAKNPAHVQVTRQIINVRPIKIQYDRRISIAKVISVQIKRQIFNKSLVHAQMIRDIFVAKKIRVQTSRVLKGQVKALHTSLKSGPVSHQICGGYLTDPYLKMPYLARQICAHMRAQISRQIFRSPKIKVQVNRRIVSNKPLRTQVDRKVFTGIGTHLQYSMRTSRGTHMQVLRAIYNTNLLRILWNFPSRGLNGLNWSIVAGGQLPGDFSINNVNNDIVEYVYRSQATTITVQCDTQVNQGVFVDTLAILNHNLTTSALVLFQGTNDVSFSSIGETITLSSAKENIYWVSPYLPTQSFRYWRFVISDPTNTDGYIQLGTIVFGSALIFSNESFVDEVQRRKVHFKDSVRTAGFSNASNDRALKKAFTIDFRRLNYNDQNYKNLTDMMDYVRTSLKALWIPTPRYPERFACFGKLQEIPVENHLAISKQDDYIDFTINVDESL